MHCLFLILYCQQLRPWGHCSPRSLPGYLRPPALLRRLSAGECAGALTAAVARGIPQVVARPVRIEFPDACHWTASRALSGREPFGTTADVALFRKTLHETCTKTGWKLLAWALTPTAMELVLQTPRANLVAGMKWLLGVFTARWNRRHQAGGPLFRGRYRSVLIQADHGPWLREAIEWVHLLPVREGILVSESPLAGYPHSSLPGFLGGKADELGVPTLEVLRDAVGSNHAQRLESLRRQAGVGLEPKPETAWCHGGEAFRARIREMLAQGDPSLRRVGTADPVPGVAEAETIIRTELAALGWDQARLDRTAKSHPFKVQLALRLRRETTVTIPWIAHRLVMGSPHSVRNLLAAARRAEAEAAPAPDPSWPPPPESSVPEGAPEAFDVRWD